jgi:ribonuclease D
MSDVAWIDSAETLAAQAAKMTKGPWLAVDTEADSLHHYKESVCLVSVLQTGGNTFLVDPLAFSEMGPLWEIAGSCPWIIHGADFDLRMMRRIGAPEPTEVFDTMIGAQLCGLKGIGYAALVELYFGIKLNKASQKADWSARPLTPAMLEYAPQDVVYLDGIRENLTAKLRELGREEWHRESSGRVLRASRVLKEIDLEEAWKIDGWNKLDYSAWPILRQLWFWRDGEAAERDVPTFKVLSNDRLLEMSDWVDANRNADHVPGYMVPSNCRGARLLRLHDAIWRGKMEQPVPPPPAERRPRRNHAVDRKAEHIKKGRDALAAQMGLDPSLIASKLTVYALAAEGPAGAERLIAENRWCRWQADLLKSLIEA